MTATSDLLSEPDGPDAIGATEGAQAIDLACSVCKRPSGAQTGNLISEFDCLHRGLRCLRALSPPGESFEKRGRLTRPVCASRHGEADRED
jgi:hypothetical protein